MSGLKTFALGLSLVTGILPHTKITILANFAFSSLNFQMCFKPVQGLITLTDLYDKTLNLTTFLRIKLPKHLNATYLLPVCQNQKGQILVRFWIWSHYSSPQNSGSTTGCRPSPPPPPLQVGMSGKIKLNEGITPLLPTGIGERYCKTISNLGHACSALAPMWTPPYMNESAELTQGAL